MVDEEENNEKIIKKYNEINEKYEELQKKMNLIKQEQDKAGIEMMNNAINSNNYEDEISNIENKLNQFLDEQNFKFDNSIKEIYNNYLSDTTNKENEMNKLKMEVSNTQEMANNIKMNISPINDIPKIQKNINLLDEQMKEIKINYGQITKEHEDIDSKNNEIRQSLLNANKDSNNLNEQIRQNQIDIEDIKNNYLIKNDLNDINEKVSKINNEIGNLKENYEKNKNALIHADNELNDINIKKDDIILKEEFDEEMIKNQNELNEIKNISYNKIKESNNNYNNILNKFEQDKKK